MATRLMSASRRRVGVVRSIVYFFAGEPDLTQRELKRASSHGALVLALGRALATPLMLMFSFGALVTLAAVPLLDNLARIEAHATPNYVSLVGVAVTLVFVICADVAMLVASVLRRALRARGATWRETWKLNAIMWSVGALEAATFIAMVAMYEHPASYWQWALAVARGVFAPPIAIFLASAEKPVVTDRDIQHLLQQRAGNGLLALLDERLNATDAAQRPDMAQLFALHTHVHSPMGATPAERERWYETVMQALEQMNPDSVRANAERAVAQAREGAERELAQLRAQAERAIEQARASASQRVADALLALISSGELPSWLLDERPELGALTRETLLTALGGGASARSLRAPRRLARLSAVTSRSDRMRAALAELDIDEARRPADVSRGVYVATSALAQLVRDDEPLSTDEQRRVMNDANGGLVRKSGTSLVAPAERVLAELRRLHRVSDRADATWSRLVDSANDSDSGDEPSVEASA